MARLLFALLCAALTLPSQAQDTHPAQSTDRSDLLKILSFEAQPKGGMPGGWAGGPPGTIFADDKVVHGGRWSARIQREADSPSDFSVLTVAYASGEPIFRGLISGPILPDS